MKIVPYHSSIAPGCKPQFDKRNFLNFTWGNDSVNIIILGLLLRSKDSSWWSFPKLQQEHTNDYWLWKIW